MRCWLHRRPEWQQHHSAQGSSLGHGVHSKKQRRQDGHTLGSFRGPAPAYSIAVGPLSSNERHSLGDTKSGCTMSRLFV